MEINRWERIAMNNPLRRLLQNWIEFCRFRELLSKNHINLSQKRILDLACGSGYSLTLLQRQFDPSLLIGFDLMPSQIKLASKINNKALLFEGDIQNLGLKNEQFDALFGFGILHHILDWKKAVAEIARVTIPGGYILLEEPDKKASRFFRKYVRFNIPPAGEFQHNELIDQFKSQGLILLDRKKILLASFMSFLFQKDK